MTRGFFTGVTAEGFSCFYFTTENPGELVEQAERKESPSTLIPDVDNAAVGNAVALLQEDTTKGILLFFRIFWERRKRDPLMWRTEGDRPEFCRSAMGSRVPA